MIILQILIKTAVSLFKLHTDYTRHEALKSSQIGCVSFLNVGALVVWLCCRTSCPSTSIRGKCKGGKAAAKTPSDTKQWASVTRGKRNLTERQHIKEGLGWRWVTKWCAEEAERVGRPKWLK